MLSDRAMRVLHLPTNVASQISVTVRAQREIGIHARGLVLAPSTIQSQADVEVLPPVVRRRPASWTRRFKTLASAIAWADVVHWHFGTALMQRALDVRLVQLLRKPRLVEFWGSDIRIPEIAAADNPFLARIGADHEYGAFESYRRSRNTQGLFAGAGFACVIPSEELLPYVQPDLFPKVWRSRQRVLLAEYPPRFPDPNVSCPVIVHSPSAKAYKGTSAVQAALEKLPRSANYRFELVHGLPKEQAQTMVSEADIFLDQFVGGDYGLAAVEAMALGKPVVCYIKPAVAERQPSPVVNANADNLSEVLSSLIESGQRRHEIGRQSRAFVETHHDAHKVAAELLEIYRALLDGRG